MTRVQPYALALALLCLAAPSGAIRADNELEANQTQLELDQFGCVGTWCCDKIKCEGTKSTAANYEPVFYKNCEKKPGKWTVDGAMERPRREWKGRMRVWHDGQVVFVEYVGDEESQEVGWLYGYKSGLNGSKCHGWFPQYVEGRSCRIVVTQPRRVAAKGLAQRVAQQVGQDVGELIGYRMGGHEKKDRSHIVLDEVHERFVEADFLMALLRLNLSRPETWHQRIIKWNMFEDIYLDSELLRRYHPGVIDNAPPFGPLMPSSLVSDKPQVSSDRLTMACKNLTKTGARLLRSLYEVHHIHVVLAFLPGLDQMPGLRFLFSIHHRRGYGEQRRGRTGRTCDGRYYCMVERRLYEALQDFDDSGVERSSLTKVALEGAYLAERLNKPPLIRSRLPALLRGHENEHFVHFFDGVAGMWQVEDKVTGVVSWAPEEDLMLNELKLDHILELLPSPPGMSRVNTAVRDLQDPMRRARDALTRQSRSSCQDRGYLSEPILLHTLCLEWLKARRGDQTAGEKLGGVPTLQSVEKDIIHQRLWTQFSNKVVDLWRLCSPFNGKANIDNLKVKSCPQHPCAMNWYMPMPSNEGDRLIEVCLNWKSPAYSLLSGPLLELSHPCATGSATAGQTRPGRDANSRCRPKRFLVACGGDYRTDYHGDTPTRVTVLRGVSVLPAKHRGRQALLWLLASGIPKDAKMTALCAPTAGLEPGRFEIRGPKERVPHNEASKDCLGEYLRVSDQSVQDAKTFYYRSVDGAWVAAEEGQEMLVELSEGQLQWGERMLTRTEEDLAIFKQLRETSCRWLRPSRNGGVRGLDASCLCARTDRFRPSTSSASTGCWSPSVKDSRSAVAPGGTGGSGFSGDVTSEAWSRKMPQLSGFVSEEEEEEEDDEADDDEEPYMDKSLENVDKDAAA
eukprot:g28821.t1